jgi:hypothetical protein
MSDPKLRRGILTVPAGILIEAMIEQHAVCLESAEVRPGQSRPNVAVRATLRFGESAHRWESLWQRFLTA